MLQNSKQALWKPCEGSSTAGFQPVFAAPFAFGVSIFRPYCCTFVPKYFYSSSHIHRHPFSFCRSQEFDFVICKIKFPLRVALKLNHAIVFNGLHFCTNSSPKPLSRKWLFSTISPICKIPLSVKKLSIVSGNNDGCGLHAPRVDFSARHHWDPHIGSCGFAGDAKAPHTSRYWTTEDCWAHDCLRME